MIKSRWLSELAYMASCYPPKHDSTVEVLDERHWLFLSRFLRCLNYLSGLGKPDSLNRKRVFLAWSRGCGVWESKSSSRDALASLFSSHSSLPSPLSVLSSLTFLREKDLSKDERLCYWVTQFCQWVRGCCCLENFWNGVSWREKDFRRTFCLPLHCSLITNTP